MNFFDRFSIRTAQASDFTAVDRLFSESYPVLLRTAYSEDICTRALPLISRAQPDLVRSGKFFLVHRGSKLVGAGGWTRSAPGTGIVTPGVGHVRHVVSDYRFQRQGIGRRLLDYVMINAQGDGLSALRCFSTLNAVPFYTAMGFTEEGPVDLPLPGGVHFPAIRMHATL
ncbi:Acetyltransferase, GNAT family [Roseivivax lentus]|uniref:Acetyltransferase, GNAT family n=1 Tax=Roseivivax lentus TaxID=633194 RepID=A0A1N7NZB1_9RHOB|nr:GNAT family N-acetyltransferase [Roseivivax lentus]SIT03664.1 Acetyltransferase, GNAT family [Roseivivax lentus]